MRFKSNISLINNPPLNLNLYNNSSLRKTIKIKNRPTKVERLVY